MSGAVCPLCLLAYTLVLSQGKKCVMLVQAMLKVPSALLLSGGVKLVIPSLKYKTLATVSIDIRWQRSKKRENKWLSNIKHSCYRLHCNHTPSFYYSPLSTLAAWGYLQGEPLWRSFMRFISTGSEPLVVSFLLGCPLLGLRGFPVYSLILNIVLLPSIVKVHINFIFLFLWFSGNVEAIMLAFN